MLGKVYSFNGMKGKLNDNFWYNESARMINGTGFGTIYSINLIINLFRCGIIWTEYFGWKKFANVNLILGILLFKNIFFRFLGQLCRLKIDQK